MTAGTVTVDDDGVEHRDTAHMATALYDAIMAIYVDNGHFIAPGTEGVPVKRQMATVANRLGAAVVSYLKANAEVVISTGGLQRTPDNPGPSTWAPENTDTRAPATPKVLSVE
jgi:hypothetical protein